MTSLGDRRGGYTIWTPVPSTSRDPDLDSGQSRTGPVSKQSLPPRSPLRSPSASEWAPGRGRPQFILSLSSSESVGWFSSDFQVLKTRDTTRTPMTSLIRRRVYPEQSKPATKYQPVRGNNGPKDFRTVVRTLHQ